MSVRHWVSRSEACTDSCLTCHARPTSRGLGSWAPFSPSHVCQCTYVPISRTHPSFSTCHLAQCWAPTGAKKPLPSCQGWGRGGVQGHFSQDKDTKELGCPLDVPLSLPGSQLGSWYLADAAALLWRPGCHPLVWLGLTAGEGEELPQSSYSVNSHLLGVQPERGGNPPPPQAASSSHHSNTCLPTQGAI